MVSEKDRKILAEVNKTFSKGFKKGDASITASVYTEDAVILPPMLRGSMEEKLLKSSGKV